MSEGPTPSPGRNGRAAKHAGTGRLVGWVALAVLLCGALFVGVTDTGGERSLEERERDIASSVACPVCDGQSVADSDASAARGVRTYIADRVAEGAGDDDGEQDAERGDGAAEEHGGGEPGQPDGERRKSRCDAIPRGTGGRARAHESNISDSPQVAPGPRNQPPNSAP